MKEVLIVSGKGGTGKTSITASIASIVKNAVFADCDVDAADLHLILNPKIYEEHEFISGHLPDIIQNDCTKCGICKQNCRFNAIKYNEDKYIIDEIACEGCGVCAYFCPRKAIVFNESMCGHWYVSNTRFGRMVHAKLKIAAENSGKLVSAVRSKSREIAIKDNNDYIIIDGPPGIGCPVIASMTGVDYVIVVTEPTLSGLSDMKRVINLAKHFNIDIYVCINKYNVNPNIVQKIKNVLLDNNIPLIGIIPYDNDITSAQINRLSAIEYSNGSASKAIKDMWQNFIKLIN